MSRRTTSSFIQVFSFSLALAFPLVMQANAALAQNFPDVPQGNWYGRFVDYLAQRHIVSGYPDGTFRPTQPVTRAEFATMLVQSQGLSNTPTSTTRFSDVPGGHWASGAIETAATRGWISGYPDGTFGPSRQINMTEMYTIAAKLIPGSKITTRQAQQLLSQFRDGSSVPGWAKQDVGTTLKNGTFVSEVTPKQIDPFAIAQRADVADVLAKVLNNRFRTAVNNVPGPNGNGNRRQTAGNGRRMH
jgi:hypothetical protein